MIPSDGSGHVAKCACGKAHTLKDWHGLPIVGLQADVDDGEALELRNCRCGSTLAVKCGYWDAEERMWRPA